jgi:hypothetical protein
MRVNAWCYYEPDDLLKNIFDHFLTWKYVSSMHQIDWIDWILFDELNDFWFSFK